ncbi:MAG: hypothetical protein NVSMB52_08920 [Chloroflexota bacterium]
MVIGLLGLSAAFFVITNHAGDVVPGTTSAVKTYTRPIKYTILQGDTTSSVASYFSVDARDLVHQTGSYNVGAPLTPGLQLTIDASQLWSHISGSPLSSNEALVESTARRFHVEPALAVAVAWQESRLDQSARSSTGAVGIMQVEPSTSALASRDLNIPIDATRPADNVVAGIFSLHSLLSSYGGDQASTLAAYYEGPGNLARRGYLAGTSEYVARARQLRHALLVANPSLRW